jgi:hypothetical protein
MRPEQLTGLIKRLPVPDGWDAPRTLSFEDVRAVALTRQHLHDDVRGINASLDLIRRTRGGSWPSAAVTEDFNFVDLVWHECEFREGDSFTYATYDEAGRYLGCAYLYPLGRRAPLTEALLAYDVDVSWWITPEAYERGLYSTVHRALQHWLAVDFPFTNPFYSNAELP